MTLTYLHLMFYDKDEAFVVDHKLDINLQEGTGHLICGDSYDKSLAELFTIMSKTQIEVNH